MTPQPNTNTGAARPTAPTPSEKACGDTLLPNRDTSKALRLHDGKLVEVNNTYAIVSKEGLPEETMALYNKLKACNCLLQYVSSGVVAVTKSHREPLAEFLQLRQEEYRAAQCPADI